MSSDSGVSAPTQGAPGSPGRDAASLLLSADLGAEIRIYGRGAWAPPALTTSPLPPPPLPRGAGRQSALGAAGRTPLEQSPGTPSNPQTQLCAPHYPFHLPRRHNHSPAHEAAGGSTKQLPSRTAVAALAPRCPPGSQRLPSDSRSRR